MWDCENHTENSCSEWHKDQHENKLFINSISTCLGLVMLCMRDILSDTHLLTSTFLGETLCEEFIDDSSEKYWYCWENILLPVTYNCREKQTSM